MWPSWRDTGECSQSRRDVLEISLLMMTAAQSPGQTEGESWGDLATSCQGNLPTLKPLGTPAVVIPFAKVNGIYPNIDKNCETSDRGVGWVRRGWGRKASAAGVTGSVARMRRRQSGRVEKNYPERHWAFAVSQLRFGRVAWRRRAWAPLGRCMELTRRGMAHLVPEGVRDEVVAFFSIIYFFKRQE